MQLVNELYLTLRKTIHCQKINIGEDPWKKKKKKKISPSDFRWRRRKVLNLNRAARTTDRISAHDRFQQVRVAEWRRRGLTARLLFFPCPSSLLKFLPSVLSCPLRQDFSMRRWREPFFHVKLRIE